MQKQQEETLVIPESVSGYTLEQQYEDMIRYKSMSKEELTKVLDDIDEDRLGKALSILDTITDSEVSRIDENNIVARQIEANKKWQEEKNKEKEKSWTYAPRNSDILTTYHLANTLKKLGGLRKQNYDDLLPTTEAERDLRQKSDNVYAALGIINGSTSDFLGDPNNPDDRARAIQKIQANQMK